MIRIAQNVLCLLRKTGGIANGKKKEQKNYCEKNRAEVVAMSIFEYNEEEEKRKLRKAEYEAGVISTKKEVAISFAEMGLSVQQIAQGIKEEEKTVRKWLNEK